MNNTPIRILIVEDNEINQKVLRIILEQNGYQYEIAADGVEALALYKREQFDLVLMDCQMPNMDGLEATAQIRSAESQLQNRRCPIVALTANAMSGDREKCLAHGMDDFLAKPFKSNELLAKVRAWSQFTAGGAK